MRANGLLLLLCLALPLAAQQVEDESAEESPAQEEAAESQGSAENQPDPEQAATAQGFETFTPSEDISEDLSVPFPVDI